MTKKYHEPAPLFLTPEKVLAIQCELAEIENTILPAIRKRLAIAYEDGDLPENNPYLTANDDLQEVLKRRNDLLALMVRVKLFNKLPTKAASKNIRIGETLTVSINGLPAQTVRLVASEEADPQQGQISVDSPIGRALLESNNQSDIEVRTPNGVIPIKIL